jgi:hypothetical protein
MWCCVHVMLRIWCLHALPRYLSTDLPDPMCHLAVVIRLMAALRRFDTGATSGTLSSARDVYKWLLHAHVPLDFEISTMFWDSVKRYLFLPILCAYGLLPLVTAAWSVQSCNSYVQVQQILLSVSLVVPNLCTAFVFQVWGAAVVHIGRLP